MGMSTARCARLVRRSKRTSAKSSAANPVERAGKPPLPGTIKRDKKGEVVTKDAQAPSWARLADEAEFLASQAADSQVEDPNFEEMKDAALQAYAAERGVPFTAKTSRDDLITAIKAAYDPTR
jgi:hypothetical protein